MGLVLGANSGSKQDSQWFEDGRTMSAEHGLRLWGFRALGFRFGGLGLWGLRLWGSGPWGLGLWGWALGFGV